MPQLQIVTLEEAQGQGRYVPDYIAFIQQVPEGKAGKLILSEEENPVTVRRWLALAGKAMHIPLGIRRREKTIYFWVAPPLTDEHPTGSQHHQTPQAAPFLMTDAEIGQTPDEAQPAAENEGSSGSPGEF